MSVLKIKDPKTGLWKEINTIVGPQGPQGIQGEVGPVGPQGPKGDDGFIKFEELTDEQKEELRGPQGIPGPKGNDGYTPVKGVDYFDGEDGPAGEDGYTPVKGVDYFTEEEKAEIVEGYTPLFALPSGQMSDEAKAVLQSVYDLNGFCYLLLLPSSGVPIVCDCIQRASPGLTIYFSRYNGSRASYTFKFTNGKLSQVVWPTLVECPIDGSDVSIEASYSPSGAKATAQGAFKYIKDNYYNKTAVNDLISGLTAGINLQIVEALPTENIDTNTIYLMLKEEAFLNDYYDEYMYINSKWELIGNTRVDLTGLTAADISYDDSALDITIPTVQAAINHLLENMLDTAGVENLLADKGFVTEERVNELITTALGSITNAEEVSY